MSSLQRLFVIAGGVTSALTLTVTPASASQPVVAEKSKVTWLSVKVSSNGCVRLRWGGSRLEKNRRYQLLIDPKTNGTMLKVTGPTPRYRTCDLIADTYKASVRTEDNFGRKGTRWRSKTFVVPAQLTSAAPN